MTDRQGVENELNKLGLKRRAQPFLDWCESRNGELDMRVGDTVECAIGPGSMDLDKDYGEDHEGHVTNVAYRVGRSVTVQHWADGEHLSNTRLEDVTIDEDGNLSGELGELSNIKIRSGARQH